jgi:glutamate/tyrosine decarboxylase-like PLP-dependent enzyme
MTAYSHTLPREGLSSAQVLERVRDFRSQDPPFERGQMTAYSMMGSHELQDVVHHAYGVYFFQNAIVRRFMPGLREMEDQVKVIAASILSGGVPGVRTNLTSGGSESLFCGLHAAREWAKERYPHVTQPEVVVPFSAHATISKACHYLGLKLTRVPVGPDYRADVALMERAIGPNTIALLGSAPSWPYGKFDPIERIAALGKARDLWVHVDACVGGYLAPFVARLGYPIPLWDFSVPGVTSISADLHKYGYAPKSASTIAFRSEDLQRYHQVHPSDWPGATYAAESMLGSRPAGAVAAAWTVLHYLGESGYLDYARRTMENKQRLLDGLRKLGMQPWDTELCVLLFETAELPASAVVGALGEAGWVCMGTQKPQLVQLIIDPLAGAVVDEYLQTLASVLRRLRGGNAGPAGDLSYAD